MLLAHNKTNFEVVDRQPAIKYYVPDNVIL